MLQISAREDYVCPIFSDEIRIVDAVHPLLEGNVRNTIAVPNNIVRNFHKIHLQKIQIAIFISDCNVRLQFFHNNGTEYEW